MLLPPNDVQTNINLSPSLNGPIRPFNGCEILCEYLYEIIGSSGGTEKRFLKKMKKGKFKKN